MRSHKVCVSCSLRQVESLPLLSPWSLRLGFSPSHFIHWHRVNKFLSFLTWLDQAYVLKSFHAGRGNCFTTQMLWRFRCNLWRTAFISSLAVKFPCIDCACGVTEHLDSIWCCVSGFEFHALCCEVSWAHSINRKSILLDQMGFSMSPQFPCNAFCNYWGQ